MCRWYFDFSLNRNVMEGRGGGLGYRGVNFIECSHLLRQLSRTGMDRGTLFQGWILELGLEVVDGIVLESEPVPVVKPGDGVEDDSVEYVEVSASGDMGKVGQDVTGSGEGFGFEEVEESDTVVELEVVQQLRLGVLAMRGNKFKLMVELLKVTGKVEVKELVVLERLKFFSRRFLRELSFFLSSFSRFDFSFLIALYCSLQLFKVMAALSVLVSSL